MIPPLPAEALQERSVIIGSMDLLKALWREHPAQLEALAARGRSVVRLGPAS